MNVNGLGAKAIKKLHNQALETGDIESGQLILLQYDGTNFQMQSQTATGGVSSILRFQVFSSLEWADDYLIEEVA